MGLDPLSIVLATTAIISTGASLYSGAQQADNQKNALNSQRKASELQAARERRDSIRQARMAYGASQQAAANQGVAESSSAQGGQGSIISQLNSNLSFLDKMQTFSDATSKSLGEAATWGNHAQTFGAVASLATQGIQYAPAVAGVFRPPTASTPSQRGV